MSTASSVNHQSQFRVPPTPRTACCAEPVGEREIESRVEQRGGLARTGRADEDVPRQLVDVLPRRQRSKPASHRLADWLSEPCLTQDAHRFLEALAQRSDLLRGGSFFGPRRSGGLLEQALDELAVRLAGPEGSPYDACQIGRDDDRDDDPAHRFRLERAIVGERDERAGEPDEQRDREQAERRQHPTVKDDSEQLLHRSVPQSLRSCMSVTASRPGSAYKRDLDAAIPCAVGRAVVRRDRLGIRAALGGKPRRRPRGSPAGP